ncbi:MAG: tRNA lysidine(34) synthetase TilS [Lachnospiraceae bacterium]|nr:tRNA lysidine(34) synthetase TilS [Lachnospiraceae bacterium]
MLEKLIRFVEEFHMIEKGDHLLVAVSGGADSVCLLQLLLRAKGCLGFCLSVVHVEHGLRGEESKEDMNFVKELCDKWQVPCYCKEVDVKEKQRLEKTTEEETARNLRYEAFYQVAEKVGANKIALAHNANDQAETMLFFLSRGTGLKGLCPMQPCRKMVIRPLLFAQRGEIEGYLKEINQSYRTDATNKDTTYSRNRIRKEVLPILCEMNPMAVQHFLAASFSVKKAMDALEDMQQTLYNKYVESSENGITINDTLLEEKPYFVDEIIKQSIFSVAKSAKDIGATHVAAVENLFTLQVGRRVDLPYHLVGKRDYHGVRIEKEQPCKKKTDPVKLKIPGETKLENGDSIFTRVFPVSAANCEIPMKSYTKWFDYAIIKDDLFVRPKETGDYMVIDAKGGKKKMKKIFVDEKIPSGRREDVLLLTRGNEVLWAVGLRRSEALKVTSETTQILEVRYCKGEEKHE